MIAGKVPVLVRGIVRGNFAFLEPCLDLLLLPLAFHVTLLLLASRTPFWPVRGLALFGLAVVVTHLIAGILVTGGGYRDVAVLFRAPFYIAWKLLLIPSLLKSSRSGNTWVRTERAPTRKLP